MAILDFARAEAAKRGRHLQHPQLCIDAVAEGISHGGAAGLKKVRAATGFRRAQSFPPSLTFFPSPALVFKCAVVLALEVTWLVWVSLREY